MARGGSRKHSPHKACAGQGCEACNQTGKATAAASKKRIKAKPQELAGPVSLSEKRNICQEVIEALNAKEQFKCCPDVLADKSPNPHPCLKCMLLRDARDPGPLGNSTRKWLTEMAQGKAVHHVNHMHDKPIDINVNLNLGQRLAAARKRALGR